MKAIIVREPGCAEQLAMGEVPAPEPTEEELLVRVKATALNRADILQREGKYPPPPGASPLLGLEMAGVVERVGEKMHRLEGRRPGVRPAAGGRVCGVLRDSGENGDADPGKPLL